MESLSFPHHRRMSSVPTSCPSFPGRCRSTPTHAEKRKRENLPTYEHYRCRFRRAERPEVLHSAERLLAKTLTGWAAIEDLRECCLHAWCSTAVTRKVHVDRQVMNRCIVLSVILYSSTASGGPLPN